MLAWKAETRSGIQLAEPGDWVQGVVGSFFGVKVVHGYTSITASRSRSASVKS